ncbi:P-selectin [Amphiprion ocellaris]|uniref:E-selectin n=1 Tax=Amphiprion ocellaris TaxID=80972 RepID=A0AAQ5ZMS6_AMPOC|nr:P-selectin [Amphiprion ocellaris]
MSADMRLNVHHRLLIAALVVFAQQLSSRGGAQAWTYNYSTSPSRRWLEARQWCQEHFTDMVAIHNQEETDFLNELLPRNSKYYWIGIRKVAGVWTWVETNENVPEEAQNWATSEPDRIAGQDCVEIYIKRDKDAAKWNNEKCQQRKGTVCYSASCRQDSCSAHADCVETIGNYTCKCHPGFSGPSCEDIACNPLADPAHGSQLCFHPFGSNRFNSSCLFSCERGFRLVGESQLFCQASGHWNQPVPLCQAEQCPDLSHTNFSSGTMTCRHPVGPHSYNSTCEFRCDEGFDLIGEDRIRCDHSGQWTASVPACTVVQCSSIKAPLHAHMQCKDPIKEYSYGSMCTVQCEDGFDLIGANMTECSSQANWSHALPDCKAKRCNPIKSPPHGSLSCSDPNGSFSFGSRCTEACDEGFLLNGTSSFECTSLGVWSADMPSCLAKRCPPLNSTAHGSFICSDPHGNFSFGSRCTTTCEEGFILNGTAETECTSSGTWSTDVPHCLAKTCHILQSPPHGSLICSKPHGEFSFGSQCTTTCEEGFILNGTADTECTSLGTWSTEIPHCLAKRCPTLKSPPHGSLNCSKPHGEFSFGSQCTTTCEEGFLLNGTADTECTSAGTWNEDIPQCTAKRCATLKSPPHGSLICSKPHGEFSFGSQCTTTCEEGFLLNGTSDTECTSAGKWSTDIPQCLAKACPALSSPSHGSLFCSDPHGEFSFGSQCTTTCEEGFVLNGIAKTECTSLGTWNIDIPRCSAKICPTLTSPSHGSLLCSDPHEEFSFGSQCTSTCDEGFLLIGSKDTNCTSVGRWSREMPRCQARQCPLLAEAPQHGVMNCSHPNSPFSYGSTCDFACSEGFWLRGTPTMTCNTSGLWSQNLPTCQPVRCESIRALPLSLSMNCSHPLGDFSFGSQCVFTCNEGFSLNGTSMLVCSSTGFWSDSLPSCTGMSMGTAMLMYTGVGASSAVLVLILVGLVLLVMWQFRKRGPPIMAEDHAWEETENPAFEF